MKFSALCLHRKRKPLGLLHYNRFFENITTLGFFPQITRPTRLSGESNTLIDNIFTNDFCKPHLSGILVTPISDHLMQFCTIIGKKERSTKKYPKYIEVKKLTPLAINNFKQAIVKSNVYDKLKTDPDANPNYNYEILSSVIIESKANHLPKKTQRFNKYKHKKEKWMSSALLKSVVHKNKLYRDWKSTTDNNDYQIKQVNFKTYERILKNMIQESKQKYYFDMFSAQKNGMKKTWATIWYGNSLFDITEKYIVIAKYLIIYMIYVWRLHKEYTGCSLSCSHQGKC